MIGEERLKAILGSERFISITNCKTHWKLTHKNDAGGEAAICDKWLDRLLETWDALLEQFELAE